MIKTIKRAFYFPLAYYFRFWAGIQLNAWKPKIIIITGSSGKTTLLHLIESQIGKKAKYSHHANSSYGIPFDILGLSRKKLTPDEWIFLFLLAPFKAFKSIPKEKLYIVEADCDRPGEGKFLAGFLNPEITLWISSSLTHSANFDSLIKNKLFATVEEAIAYEFGFFPQYTKKLIIANGNSSLIQEQLKRTHASIKFVTRIDLKSYKINNKSTEFVIEHKKYSINYIVPEEIFYSIQMTNLLMKYLNLPFDATFNNLVLPPGRSSVFSGIKNTTIIDSTYNATPDGIKSILKMFGNYPKQNEAPRSKLRGIKAEFLRSQQPHFAKASLGVPPAPSSSEQALRFPAKGNKWLVLGDMIELGEKEKEAHEKLAEIINSMNLSKVILIGPRVSKYAYPKLNPPAGGAMQFLTPREGLNYILKNIKGEETILFKGARFLEGIVERLLQNKNDADKLVRREKVWENRRKSFGL